MFIGITQSRNSSRFCVAKHRTESERRHYIIICGAMYSFAPFRVSIRFIIRSIPLFARFLMSINIADVDERGVAHLEMPEYVEYVYAFTICDLDAKGKCRRKYGKTPSRFHCDTRVSVSRLEIRVHRLPPHRFADPRFYAR